MAALKSEIWENIYCMNHINDISNVFLKTFLCTLNHAVQLSFTRKQKNNRRINLGIKMTFKRKQGVYVLSK